MRALFVIFCCTAFGAAACTVGTVHTGDLADLGEACESDSDCASGMCIPMAEDQVCSQPCDVSDECTNGTVCLEYADAGTWCQPPDCVPDCADRCCGDDGCGGSCPDICPSQCDPGTCECTGECATVGETRPCSAYGSCTGLETCQADLTWSACASDAWECTEPGADESCQVGACSGIRQCGSDCAWGDCAPDCPVDTECCADGCVDLASDAVNCGECERECLYGEPPAPDPCYSGACATKCCRNNPTELCDDESFLVPSPYVPMYLVCTNGNGGVAYFATETGPQCTDGIRRCRCWAENGMDFQDYLPALYIAHMTCTQAGQVLPVDLSAWEGQHIYVGAHEQVDGSGDMTRACVAEGI